MIKWINDKEKEGIVTCYSTNMTFNSVASIFLLNAYKVLVGVDENSNIIVKPISKDRFDMGDLESSGLFDIASKKSYSRISSTSLMSSISEMIGIKFSNVPLKFKSIYDKDNEYLIIKVGKEKK